jgi:hypothetical protein
MRSPEENLALDEALLELGRESFRVWESPVHFVVMGRSGKDWKRKWMSRRARMPESR